MKSRVYGFALILITVVLISGCQTKPAPVSPEPTPAPAAPAPASPAPAAPAPEPVPKAEPVAVPALPPLEKSSFSVTSNGFWPSAESRRKAIEFALVFGNASSVRSWKVEIAGGIGIVKRFSGTAAGLPSTLSWDGRRDSGELAPEGGYNATFSVDYGGDYPAVSLTSDRFVLSVSAPRPFLRSDPGRFEIAPTGVKGPVSLEVGAEESLARIETWSIEILGPDGIAFRSFRGDWPAPVLSWDGRSTVGAYVEAAKRYTAVLEVVDEYGHSGAARLVIPVSALPYATERSYIKPLTTGFSPNGDKTMDEMEFSLTFGNPGDVTAWKVEIVHPERGALRSWSGGPASLPASLRWDGLGASGEAAPEGRYTALLTIDYGKTYAQEAVRSPSFVLDVTPPKVSIRTAPTFFSPDGDGIADKLYIKLDADSGLARAVDYGLDIFFPDGTPLVRFDGPWPAGEIFWDGTGPGGSVESIEEYPMLATVRDEFGNVGRAEWKAGTDIILIKEDGRYRIVISGIVFKSYTADYVNVEPERAKRNDYTLDRLAVKLAKLEGYDIGLVGHAVMIHWDNPVLGEEEQNEILIPLSRARAKAIADALVERGIDASRLWTDGVGAAQQIVPDSDVENRWKNRRVEFFLTKRK